MVFVVAGMAYLFGLGCLVVYVAFAAETVNHTVRVLSATGGMVLWLVAGAVVVAWWRRYRGQQDTAEGS